MTCPTGEEHALVCRLAHCAQQRASLSQASAPQTQQHDSRYSGPTICRQEPPIHLIALCILVPLVALVVWHAPHACGQVRAVGTMPE